MSQLEETDRLSLVTGGLIEERNQQNGNGPRCIATCYLLLPLLRCLLLLLIQLFTSHAMVFLYFYLLKFFRLLGFGL